ncbi:hypothetical protein [Shewanella donghaensis]|uniref:hypothetical protein n=1 Tax=Shewanella donghaensis TaxID=238836 RepID=UPI0011821B29|nr:hypothetical protein [Shewanella donghaensis]
MLIAELENAVNIIVNDLKMLVDKGYCSVEFETYFTEKVIEQLEQLSYEYPIETKNIPIQEKARWGNFWRVSYDDNLFINLNFTIKLCSRAGVILEISSVSGMQNIIKKHR